MIWSAGNSISTIPLDQATFDAHQITAELAEAKPSIQSNALNPVEFKSGARMRAFNNRNTAVILAILLVGVVIWSVSALNARAELPDGSVILLAQISRTGQIRVRLGNGVERILYAIAQRSEHLEFLANWTRSNDFKFGIYPFKEDQLLIAFRHLRFGNLRPPESFASLYSISLWNEQGSIRSEATLQNLPNSSSVVSVWLASLPPDHHEKFLVKVYERDKPDNPVAEFRVSNAEISKISMADNHVRF